MPEELMHDDEGNRYQLNVGKDRCTLTIGGVGKSHITMRVSFPREVLEWMARSIQAPQISAPHPLQPGHVEMLTNEQGGHMELHHLGDTIEMRIRVVRSDTRADEDVWDRLRLPVGDWVRVWRHMGLPSA